MTMSTRKQAWRFLFLLLPAFLFLAAWNSASVAFHMKRVLTARSSWSLQGGCVSSNETPNFVQGGGDNENDLQVLLDPGQSSDPASEITIVLGKFRPQDDEDKSFRGSRKKLTGRKKKDSRDKQIQMSWLEAVAELEKQRGVMPDGNGPQKQHHSQCWSRREAPLYFGNSGPPLSKALAEAMAAHDNRHKECAAFHPDLGQRLQNLVNGNETALDGLTCRYIIWVEQSLGLGNRIISLLATYLYALVTDRVLLLASNGQTQSLLCDPSEEASWWFPTDLFPVVDNDTKYPTMSQLEDNLEGRGRQPRAVFIHLGGPEYSDNDRTWYCGEGHDRLASVPVVLHRSSIYFEPSLWLIPSLSKRLHTLFPDRAVTSTVARAILHPSNKLWASITEIHKRRLRENDVLVGVQVRNWNAYNPEIAPRILDCFSEFGVVPQPGSQLLTKHGNASRWHVMIASLEGQYRSDLEKIFGQHPNTKVTWESLSAHTVESHSAGEFEDALIEMYVLSLSKHLVISMKSTLGYIAMMMRGSPVLFLNIREEFAKTNGMPACFPSWTSNLCQHDLHPIQCEREGSTAGLLQKVNAYVTRCQDVQDWDSIMTVPLHMQSRFDR